MVITNGWWLLMIVIVDVCLWLIVAGTRNCFWLVIIGGSSWTLPVSLRSLQLTLMINDDWKSLKIANLTIQSSSIITSASSDELNSTLVDWRLMIGDWWWLKFSKSDDWWSLKITNLTHHLCFLGLVAISGSLYGQPSRPPSHMHPGCVPTTLASGWFWVKLVHVNDSWMII